MYKHMYLFVLSRHGIIIIIIKNSIYETFKFHLKLAIYYFIITKFITLKRIPYHVIPQPL